jgi:hypothetical protein
MSIFDNAGPKRVKYKEAPVPPFIETVIHFYSFDKEDRDESEQWEALKTSLKPTNHHHCSHGLKDYESCRMPMPGVRKLTANTGLARISTEHVYNDQWNTVPFEDEPEGTRGYRVFDWYERYLCKQPGSGRQGPMGREGHWLELNEDLLNLRRNIFECGYCGYKEYYPEGRLPEDHNGFCGDCLTSPYLAEKHYHLTRMVSLFSKPWYNSRRGAWPERAELTPAEMEQMKKWVFQAYSNPVVRDPEKRAKDLAKDLEKAQTLLHREQLHVAGIQWLQEHAELPIDNLIYYNHTGMFTFGWQGDGLPEEAKKAIRVQMEGFPANWEFAKPKDKK